MRVLLVGDYPPPHGGISVHVASLAEVLRRRGCEVRVLDVGRPPKATAPAGVAIARTRPQVASEIFRAARQGHLVHVHVSGHNAPSWSLAAVSTWLSRPFGPSLVTVHSGLAPAYLARGPSRWAARLACAPASRVICANEDIQRSLRRCDLRPGRLETLPAFIDERSPLPPVPALFAALRSRSRRVLAIALGEGPEYGRQLFLETLARLAPACEGLGVCAIGPGADAELQVALARQLGDRAVSLGEIAHGEVLALLAATDVFLRPTLADGDAISVREALAAGAAVVATSVVPRPAGTRVVAPHAGALAAATLGALEDPTPRRPHPLPSAHHRLLQLYTALLTPSPRLAPARQLS